jgi:hypothetical protein
MTKLLEKALEAVRRLPPDSQDDLVYYTAHDEAEEIIVPAIQHPAREREHSDA